MIRINQAAIKQAIRNVHDQLGWQGTYGIALLALAGAFHLLTIKPLEQRTAFMHSRVDAARSKVSIQGASFNRGDRTQELAAFFGSLPDEKEVTDVLGSIYATAEAYGVRLQEASYHLEDKDRPRVEYVMTFPMSGEYVQIRRFVFRILTSHPAMALDQIDFQRDKIGDSTLKANVRMTLFLSPSQAESTTRGPK